MTVLGGVKNRGNEMKNGLFLQVLAGVLCLAAQHLQAECQYSNLKEPVPFDVPCNPQGCKRLTPGGTGVCTCPYFFGADVEYTGIAQAGREIVIKRYLYTDADRKTKVFNPTTGSFIWSGDTQCPNCGHGVSIHDYIAPTGK
jgi:hypothetical protein